MKSPELNLVVLRSPDLARAVAFYIKLGLQFIQHQHGNGPEHFSAKLGGSVFELYPKVAGGIEITLGTRIGFRVASLDTCIAAFTDYPDAIVSPPKDSPWGRRAVIADPDGHRIELVESANSL